MQVFGNLALGQFEVIEIRLNMINTECLDSEYQCRKQWQENFSDYLATTDALVAAL